jgi:hypothetical protein
VDFDGDGVLDLVSGSYDPGELYLFRGQGRGQFAAREVITDQSGKPILKVPDQKDKIESFGSWMALVDWDDDGDMDIVVGTYDGMMFVRRNAGTRTEPAYVTTNEWVKADGKKLRVPGGEHANPVVADWDGDGLWDLLTGAGNGGAYWYRNVGKKGSPAFAPPATLVAAHQGIGYGELLDDRRPPRPGIRSQIAVADYDEDGKLDLLVGDFCTYLQVKPDLTAEQRTAFERLIGERDTVVGQLRESAEHFREDFKKAMNGVPKSDWETPENQAKFQAMYKELKQSPAHKKLQADYERLEDGLKAFVENQGSRGGDADVPHGYVWCFRRK